MNLKDFKKRAVKSESNTNNGWGFGGHSGYKYILGNYTHLDASLDYRHAPSTPYKLFWIGNDEASKAEFLEAISKMLTLDEVAKKLGIEITHL